MLWFVSFISGVLVVKDLLVLLVCYEYGNSALSASTSADFATQSASSLYGASAVAKV